MTAHGLVLRALGRLFGDPEEINGDHRCPTYMYRWFVANLPRLGSAVYLHRFVADDWALDLHDHPRRFVSVGLRGRYTEVRPGGVEVVYRAPWARSFPAEHAHRLVLAPGEECWTLVLVLPKSRQWGFWTSRGWEHWKKYVYGADALKSCGGDA